QVTNSNSRMVSTEGTTLVSPSSSMRLVMEAQTRADDGMDLLRVETFQAPNATGLPGEAELTAKIEKMAADLSALRKAPVAEPYDGPALLSGRAAAVFFHEVLGHRLEGHRQRDEEEGQTFTKKVGQEVLPKFLSVVDDPTIDELKKQGKPYGLYFDDIQGGFTITTRQLPQAFQVLPVMVYKVYADGRTDELVRGVDIVGTPLAALTRILTTGAQKHVFNGVCGAESGQVPVAAVAPSMLFSEMEVQKRAHQHERPPLLPPPGFEDGASAAKAGAQAKDEVKP